VISASLENLTSRQPENTQPEMPTMAQQDHEKDPGVTLTENDYTERPKCFNSTLQECLFVLTATMAIGQQSFFQGCIVGVTASIGTDLNMNSAEITWINAGASYVLPLSLSPRSLTTTQISDRKNPYLYNVPSTIFLSISTPHISKPHQSTPRHIEPKEIKLTEPHRLSSGAFLLSFGKLADMFGRKTLFIIGMAGFTLSLLVAGFATNAIYMDVFSGILGLFAAAVVPPAVGALGAVYEKPSKRKNRAFACFSAGNPLGFVGGMIISGVASHEYNWRASFWALAVVYALFTGLTVWTVPADGFARTPLSMEALRQFDLLGTGLVIVGFAFFSSSLSYVFLLILLGFSWGFLTGFLEGWLGMHRMAGELAMSLACSSWGSSCLLRFCTGSLLPRIH
jgi:hypothetical protein